MKHATKPCNISAIKSKSILQRFRVVKNRLASQESVHMFSELEDRWHYFGNNSLSWPHMHFMARTSIRGLWAINALFDAKMIFWVNNVFQPLSFTQNASKLNGSGIELQIGYICDSKWQHHDQLLRLYHIGRQFLERWVTLLNLISVYVSYFFWQSLYLL